MATETLAGSAPMELQERFTPQEAPKFELIQHCGNIRLWKSVAQANGWRLPSTRYHITEGEELSYGHMPDLEHAVPNFDLACRSATEVQHG